MSVRLSLLRSEQRGNCLALVLAAELDGRWREVTVLVSRWRGCVHVEFPHAATQGGETLGSRGADASVRDFGRRFVAHSDAQEAWRRCEADGREEWRRSR